MDESCGRIDVERRADDDEDIGSLSLLGSSRNHRNGLAEEHDERTQQRAVASLRAWSDLAVVGRQQLLIARIVRVVARAYFHQFAMQMDDLRRASLLVQVIDILRHHRHVVVLFQLSHQFVAFVRLHTPAFLAEHVVEISHQRGVVEPSLVGSHLLNGILLPQSVSIAESLQTTLHRHACTSQNYYLFHTPKY